MSRIKELLLNDKLTNKQIAKKLKVSISTIDSTIKILGIKRKRGRKRLNLEDRNEKKG